MPTIQYGDGPGVSLDDTAYTQMKQALTDAGVPEPQDIWVAALVRAGASGEDKYKAALKAGIFPGQPPGVVKVANMLFTDRKPPEPAPMPALLSQAKQAPAPAGGPMMRPAAPGLGGLLGLLGGAPAAPPSPVFFGRR